MRNRKKHLDIYLIILAVLILATVTLRTVAVMTELNYEYGQYVNAVIITVSDWIAFGGSIVLLSYLATIPKGEKYRASFDNEHTYVPSALVAASLIFLAISLASDTVDKLIPFYAERLRDISVIMPLAAAALAAISVYYFFLNAYIKDCASTRRASASFTAILFLCIYPAYLYFSKALPINAPNKVVDQLAYLLSALFFLYEARISLGRDRWGAYTAFGMIASLLCAYSAVPSLIVYFAKGEMISDSLAENALTLSLLIFIASRLLLMRELPQDAPTDIVVKISERSAARRREIGDSDIIQSESGEQMEFDMSIMESAESTDGILEVQDENGEDKTYGEDNDTENYETAEELLGITETDESTEPRATDNTEITETEE